VTPPHDGPPLPRLEARDLLGAERVIPDDLPRTPVLVVLAFRREQQADVDAWVAALPGAPVIEVPVIGRRWNAVRGFIDGGMRRGIGDEEVCARTWTVYTDVGAAMRPLGVRDQGRIAVAVSARDGAVRAFARGRPGEDSLREVRAALGLSAPGGPPAGG
jgi:hypothetical protein